MSTTATVDTICDFESMNLKETILRGIYGYGFEKPSNIQQKGILPIISKEDCIEQSQSGTGKTATFCIGSLQNINESKNVIQALVLAPTRELAMQIFDVYSGLGCYTSINLALCVGGDSLKNNIDTLTDSSKPIHIVVGTPGRTYDLINRKYIKTENIELLIIDEADEMLSRDFKEQLFDIFQHLNTHIQVVLMSATMPPEMFEITKKIMRNPKTILVKQEELTLEGIKQFYINCENVKWKFDTLCDLYQVLSVLQCIIYVNSKSTLETLRKNLNSQNFAIACIHGELNTSDRKQILSDFKNGATRILITTDLLARGIDIQQISLVINYELPNNKENYLHRIGRSGRFGRKGLAINFCSRMDFPKIQEIEKYYQTSIEELPENFQELLQ